MLASCCFVSAWRFPIFLAPSCLVVAVQAKCAVEFADKKPVICTTVCTTHSLWHSYIPSVVPSNYNIVNETPVFGARVLLRVGRRKTVFVISSSCSAYFLVRRSPLLLHFATPSVPITPSQAFMRTEQIMSKLRQK